MTQFGVINVTLSVILYFLYNKFANIRPNHGELETISFHQFNIFKSHFCLLLEMQILHFKYCRPVRLLSVSVCNCLPFFYGSF